MEPTSLSPDLAEHAADALRRANSVVIFTGAGVSAESGLPTFRSGANAMWNDADIARYATPHGYRAHAREAWTWYAQRARAALSVEPNPAHYAIAEIERRVPRCHVVTQNIDGLHQRAGSRTVIELHGSLGRVRCFDCSAIHEWPAHDAEPVCARCRGLLRPDVVFFEEFLPPFALEAARLAAERCDVLLAVGTSNLVWPAAELPRIAHGAGASVFIVNPDVSGQPLATHRMEHLIGRAGDVLPEVVRRAWGTA